jgi:adenine-specific DNA-methyltransferase
MAKQYKGSLSLEWYNKQKSILLRGEEDIKLEGDIPAPKINWINKDEALFYEVDETEGKGLTPFWVDRTDIRVKEARPLLLQNIYRAIEKDKKWFIEESTVEDPTIENILIKGDNLLALNSLMKIFENKPEDEKVKCIYIDPPYNTGKAFENYDDNLETSTWLTMMRDRLEKLHTLLKNDGIFYIQLDEKFIFHVKIMLEEIFGKDNFVNLFTIKTSDPSGFKTINPSPYDAAEYILMFAKNKSYYTYRPIYVKSKYDSGYNKYIKNINEDFKKWNIVGLNQHISEIQGFKDTREARKNLGEDVFNSIVAEFALNNSSSVFQGTAIGSDAGSDILELKKKSLEEKDTVCKLIRENGNIEYALNGRQIYFYSNKLKEIDGELTPAKLLTNIWMDIPYNGISNEGNVKFAESKKPEKLIERLFRIANISKNDIVLDSFSGSGTTVSVANKLQARWIGIELGNHIDTHIIKRVADVITNNDITGISKSVNWQGGGAFKYYHLGESIIKINEDGTGDFNWKLSRNYIEEAFLSSYDYRLDTDLDLTQGFIFGDNQVPLIGVQQIGTKIRVAIVSLNAPDEDNSFMTYDEIFYLYQQIKKHFNPQYINVFTNRGVEIAYDSKPEDLDVIKIPQAIFAELEK